MKAIVYPIITARDYAYAAPPIFIERDSADAALQALRDESYRIKRVAFEKISISRAELLSTRSAYEDVLDKMREIAHSMSDDDKITVYRIAVCSNV